MGAIRQIVRGESNFNIIGRARRWAVVSGVLIVLSLVGLFGRHLNLSLEFKGGTALTVSPLTPGTKVADVQTALKPFNLTDFTVQIQQEKGGSNAEQALVRTHHIADRTVLANVQEALQKFATAPNGVSIDDVGPSWGHEVSNKAVRGLIVFLILVTFYIALRFEPKMAAGALAALFHDLLITSGIYALVGFTVSPATVIALLTLLGYSLYDTVVVFDKVRENVGLVGRSEKSTYTDVVNHSVNQVLMRSINTTLSTLLPIAALLGVGIVLFGAGTLKDLALALFLGTLVGAYSSIFVASPILATLKEREPQYKRIRARLEAGGGVRAPRVPVMPSAADVAAETAAEPVRAGAPAMRVPRAAPKPRKRKRGKRR
jgi:preprotein translocase subunit SecF